MSVSGTKTQPRPSDVRTSGPSASTMYEPSAEMNVSQDIPAIVTTIPTIATGRTPTLGANREARPAETMIPPVNGRNASPASSGPKPSTRWM